MGSLPREKPDAGGIEKRTGRKQGKNWPFSRFPIHYSSLPAHAFKNRNEIDMQSAYILFWVDALLG